MTTPAFLTRGFRPFFLGAAVFAVLGMTDWMAAYLFHLPVELGTATMFQWHAHEMIFGYALAVVAGFLLTAAWNWTGRRTADGFWLALIFSFWAAARILMAGGTGLIVYAAAADLAFLLGLTVAVGKPIIHTRQKRQIPVMLILLLLSAANLSFYLGAAGWLDQGAHMGLYSGMYLVLGMVLFMGRRVIPFFTQRGVGRPVELRTERWIDVSMFMAYPVFAVSEILLPYHTVGAVLAAVLLFLNSRQIMGWHTLGIWQKPLLWSLFGSFTMINLGLLLRALMPVTAIPAFLPVHAYALGGIGVITLSMMARVTLGHTGRNVHTAPKIITIILASMFTAAGVRIFLPMVAPESYRLWVGVAGIIWIISFLLFTMAFAPMLLKKRIDAD